MSERVGADLSLPAKVLLAVRVWRSYALVLLQVRTKPLVRVAHDLGKRPHRGPRRSPELLSHAVGRTLRIGRRQARCLTGSLVLFKLLREQGDDPVLVIGLPPQAVDQRAHAWVELDGRDVGPPPGRGRNVPLARYS
jgi:hypothetical protein